MSKGEPPIPQTELATLIEILEDTSIPLRTTDPGHSRQDLEPLSRIFASANVIGLGEHSHGTREVFQSKDRLIRYLVEELDYRLLVFELPYSAGFAINQFITSGDGSAEEVLRRDDVHSIWQCEAIVELLNWMREFNSGRDPGDQVRFYGVDLHWGKPTYLESYLERVDPVFLEEIREDIDYLETHAVGGDLDIDDPVAFAETQQRVAEQARDRMESKKSSYITASSPREYELAKRELPILEESSEFWNKINEEDPQANSFRSIVMAENTEWVLDFEEEEHAAVWAHNTHILREELLDDEFPYSTVLGTYFADKDHLDYYSLGFEVREETVRVVSVEEGGFEHLERTDVPEDDVATVFTNIEADQLLIDFDALPEREEITRWLDIPPKIVGIGGRGEVSYAEVDPTNSFDGLVYIDQGSPARGLDRVD